MENNGLIDALPLWGLFIAILGVVLISVECGYRLGKFRLSRREQEKEAPVGTMVGATLVLVAFILAFTFGLASSHRSKATCSKCLGFPVLGSISGSYMYSMKDCCQ